MTGLDDVYNGPVGDVGSRRLVAGLSLFVLGTLASVFGLLFATTGLATFFGLDTFAARRFAGTLAGLGVPAVVVGIAVVLPASDRLRIAAAVGAALALVGVGLFRLAYPADWWGYGNDYTLAVTAVYALGVAITLGCLFAGVATFKVRNAPGGTVSLNVLKRGETRIVEVPTRTGLGSVGVLGSPETGPDRPVSDGGDAVVMTAPKRPPVDRYCGNCAHFDYAEVNGSLRPYCGATDEVMETMDACSEWEPNRR
ncbi:DUF7139 domain-containing protein [Natronorarus salvus]|uniref:DUF7139 domain-containing protein n=1 Tax=Natronorarus salvus TaxID=3117733 RepID=UPI002F2687FC